MSFLLGVWVWAILTFYGCGSPKNEANYRSRLGVWRSSSRHAVCFSMLADSLLPFCRLKPHDAVGKGRGMARLFHLEALLEHVIPKVDSHCDLDSQAAAAHPVVVREVSTRLPQDCGQCDPQNYLRDDKLNWFQNQHLSVYPSAPADSDLPHCCYRAHPNDEAELRKLLVSSGYSKLLPESMVAKRDDGRPLLGGLFMVEDRLGNPG